jgi:DNA-binding transcriptional MerR regulator
MTSPPASDRPNSASSSLPSPVRLPELSPEGLSLAKASERLIQRFGGIRPMANKLEVPVTTVQGWKKRGAIPAARLNDLLLAAQRHGIRLEEAELDAVGRSDDRHPAALVPDATEAPDAALEGDLETETETEAGTGSPLPEPLALPSVGPVPVNVPLAVPPLRPPLPEPLAPFETEAPALSPTLHLAPLHPAPLHPATAAPVSGHPASGHPASGHPVSGHPVSASAAAAVLPLFSSAAPAAAAPVAPGSVAPVSAAAVAAAAARLAAGGSPSPGPAGSRLLALGAVRLSLAAAAVALVAAVVTVWSLPQLSPEPSSATFPAERRLGDLESKVARVALEQGTQSSTIEKQLSALDARLKQSASRQVTDDLAQRIATLERDLPALQQRIAAQGLGSPALAVLLSATQLRGALVSANPFVNELAAFRLSGFNDPPLKQALDQIASRATPGIETEAWLIGRFSVVQGNILRAASLGNPGARLADLFLDVMADWTPPLYRLTGASEGSTARALTDRAQALMAANEFGRAVELLGQLTGLPAEVAAPWLAEARARVIADRARTLLARHMLSIAEPGSVPK